MHPRAAEFAETAADRYGIEIDVHEFDEGTKTAADAAEVVGCDVAQIASGLVFTADDEPIMVVTSGANRVDEAHLADEIGAEEVAMADPDRVREATGYGIGGVPPFCHDSEIRTYIDETLLDHDEVWAAAGTPRTVFPVDPERLADLADATPVPVTD
ncbi:YbaK/EbsC family protein [Halorientalis pallida]|uniref:YbaK/EbsC family protein n=1 Tax=Halorientalis pallida TaxID=2479928 RepID=UPI003C6F5A4B